VQICRSALAEHGSDHIALVGNHPVQWVMTQDESKIAPP
jgi:hypothetical protein